jgi:hypothetical protein
MWLAVEGRLAVLRSIAENEAVPLVAWDHESRGNSCRLYDQIHFRQSTNADTPGIRDVNSGSRDTLSCVG